MSSRELIPCAACGQQYQFGCEPGSPSIYCPYLAARDPLPFEDNCTVGGEHDHCEIHDICIEPGSDCQVCLAMESASHFDFDAVMTDRDRADFERRWIDG